MYIKYHRDARKELRKLAETESSADQALKLKMKTEDENEMKSLMKLKISETAQPSLLTVAKFLVDDYVTRLPVEKCQKCKFYSFSYIYVIYVKIWIYLFIPIYTYDYYWKNYSFLW
jgi:lipopolysaccharide biosynthesis regulator YciM